VLKEEESRTRVWRGTKIGLKLDGFIAEVE
jgi:hypothetical protein